MDKEDNEKFIQGFKEVINNFSQEELQQIVKLIRKQELKRRS